jgi:hypothetical protein
MDAAVHKFLGDIVTDGAGSVDPELHEEMIKELADRLENYLVDMYVRHLSRRECEEFIQLNKSGATSAAVEQYLKEHIPNIQQLMNQAFMEFRRQYIA